MKRVWSRYIILAFAAAMACLLSGCGAQKRQIGVDGYVYVAQSLKENDASIISGRNFTVNGGYLYYKGNSHMLQRLLLKEADSGLDLANGETVLTVSEVWREVVKNGGTEGNFSSADIWDYAVGPDGSIYCILTSGANSLASILSGSYNPDEEEEEALQQSLLYKRSPDGEAAYWLELTRLGIRNRDTLHWLAVDDEGDAYVLTADALLMVDNGGNVTETLPFEASDSITQIPEGGLLKGRDNRIYYAKSLNGNGSVFLIDHNGSLQMTETFLPSVLSGTLLREGMDCLLKASSDSLYQYDEAGGALIKILNWAESGLSGDNVQEVVQIDADHYLATVSAWMSSGENVLLTKTPVDKIPEKEIIVIASLVPTSFLRSSVAAFNRSSDKYIVTIERYGYESGDFDGAYMRLDSSLVSRNTPDILDFGNLDISKYTDKGMLEDLSLYMENEDIINRENYLSNLLDGFTIDGKLVSIPKGFIFPAVFGLVPESGADENWTLPELMALTQGNPEKRLLSRSTEYLVSEFCAPYYLERFVDWEAGQCSFDSEEFCALLDWVNSQNQADVQEQDALLGFSYLYFFEGYMEHFLKYGEGMTMHGFPSADGTGKYTFQTLDAMGMLSSSAHKEGAWEFLRFFLARDLEVIDFWFPTRLDLLEKRYQESIMTGGTMMVDGIPMNFTMTSEQKDLVIQAMKSIDFTPRTSAENNIIKIVWEEAQYLLDGSKTAEAVAQAIQNRVELMLQERGR